MSKFKVGDRVICVKTYEYWYFRGVDYLKHNGIYTITNVSQSTIDTYFVNISGEDKKGVERYVYDSVRFIHYTIKEERKLKLLKCYKCQNLK